MLDDAVGVTAHPAATPPSSTRGEVTGPVWSTRANSMAARYRVLSALALLGMVWLAGCRVPDEGTQPAGPTTSASPLTGPLHDPDRIGPADRQAIELLAGSGAVEPDHAHGHAHGQVPVTVATPLFTGDAATFANQWLAAQRSTSRFDTIAEVEELGFVRTSAPGAGVGTHWVRWPQVAEPFDPAEPAMVLFDESREPARLVAYVYWVQSPEIPVGFAGPNDELHQHTGLCIVNGWTLREEAGSPARCPGSYLAGGDLWMLHAWVVEGLENRLGDFANIHPALCPSKYGTPDVSRCPEF